MSTRLEHRIRRAERRVADAYGLRMTERGVAVAEPAVQVRVLTVGSGAPVLYINGLATPAMGFAPLIARLPGYRHILVDLPGHSLAPPYRWQGRPVRDLGVGVLTGVLDGLGLGEVQVVGSSLGGLFALWTAVDAPGRVSRAVIVGTPATALPGTRGTASMAALTSPAWGSVHQCLMRLPSPRSVARSALAEAIGPDAARGLSDDLLDLHRLPLRLPGQADSYRSLLCRLMRGPTPRGENVLTQAELAGITTPMLFVWGERDVFCAPDRGRDSVARIPTAKLSVVPGGHSPWLDDAAGCAALIGDFLAREEVAAGDPRRG
ncbi:alpha/beta fold hydrolase [Nocardia sp. NPDC050406]|uniref:alpha/beta fold hydrolase n=1 Tax=Nocardia sp. NPDC050406 TaxID=3364318 RepID=UPI003796B6AF